MTIETALTITNERITLTADTDAGAAPTVILDNITGATSGTANDLNYITGNDAGLMQLELSAANVNRVGRMFLTITDAANHVPVFHEFTVLPQAIYDWLIAGTAGLAWNAAWDAEVQSEVADALNAAVPGSPAADSLNERVKTIDDNLTASIYSALTLMGLTYIETSVSDATSPVAGDFTAAAGLSATNDFYNGMFVAFTSGGLKGVARKVSDYVGATRQFLFTGATSAADGPFPANPTDGDTFVILGRHGT